LLLKAQQKLTEFSSDPCPLGEKCPLMGISRGENISDIVMGELSRSVNDDRIFIRKVKESKMEKE
jgi:hypothetical protein